MNLSSYIDLHQLLENTKLSHKDNRAFALKHKLEKRSTKEKLEAWIKEYSATLPKPPQSELFCKYLYGVTLIFVILALVVGFLSGVALLSYSGKEPVNLIYFLAIAVFLPIVTMVFAGFSMYKVGSPNSMLMHISPAYWMEKILKFISNFGLEKIQEFRITPLILSWLVIKRAQLLSLLFAVGLLLSLLVVVTTKDIAFAWSTTLNISPEEFHAFLNSLSLPWREWIPSAVPSMDLIEKSQYFRLGGKLDSDMISNANALGEWWKFLASATLFYAVLLRVIFWIVARLGLRQSIDKSAMTIEGAERLLYQMQTPVVSSTAVDTEHMFTEENGKYDKTMATSLDSYDFVVGWAMSLNDISLLNDSMKVQTRRKFTAGGVNTLDEDSQIIKSINGEVLLYVKSWEPPTMDTLDFIEELASVSDRVAVMPKGTVEEKFVPRDKELDIWSRKLSALNNQKVWLWQKS